MSFFRQVRDRVDIVEAAERYGLSVNRANKALCPFHDDSKPSLSFKGNRFTCFSCGRSGDVIDLIGHILNTTPIDTVKELNSAYHIGIEMGKPIAFETIAKMRHLQERKRVWQKEEQKIVGLYAAYIRLLREWKNTLAPRTPNEPMNPQFIQALISLEHMEYLFDSIFVEGNLEARMKFCREHTKEIAMMTEKLAAEQYGEINLWHPQYGVFKEVYQVA